MEGAVDLASLGPGGIPKTQEEMLERQSMMAEKEQQRISILDQILDASAGDRLKRLNLVRKDKARSVEDSLIKAAMSGQLRGKVTDTQLITMLEQLDSAAGSGASGNKSVSIQRRKYGMDSDDDDNDDDLK
jgi:programmed cell death protein 5